MTNAGGFGVFGVAFYSPEQVRQELSWIDEQVGGKPYGVDIVMPQTGGGQSATHGSILASLPEGHMTFVEGLLNEYGIAMDLDDPGLADYLAKPIALLPDTAIEILDIMMEHPIRLVANGLGKLSPELVTRCRRNDIAIGALVGTARQAVAQVEAGAEIIIAQGSEAGGHGGNISTMVLVPDVVDALKPYGDVPVLAAGGIMTGRQMAAAMTMGASGVWTGSVWLPTPESEISDFLRARFVDARSDDTVRSKVRSGKLSRHLRSAWAGAWDAPESPKPLPLPGQAVLAELAMHLAGRSLEAGNERAGEILNYYVGQGVGLVKDTRSTRQVVNDFREDFADAVVKMTDLVGA